MKQTSNLFTASHLTQMLMFASVVVLASFSMAASAQTRNYSSSSDYRMLRSGEDTNGGPAASMSASSEVPHYGKTNGYPADGNRLSHLAFEAGGGLTAPFGSKHPFVTYGYNIGLGGGWNFNKRFGALLEYQFDRNKIPGKTLAAVGAPGGNVNTWSLTVDPIFNYGNIGKWGGYITGGGGFYRKVTNYTSPQPVQYCNYFYGYCGYVNQNQTIGHFSSNQGGFNIGTGVTWQAFGPDSRAKLFGEARYVWVNSPKATRTRQGTGTEELVPITIGIRF